MRGGKEGRGRERRDGRGEEGRERKRKKGGEERRRINDLLTFSLADVSHDDHQLLLEESL